MKKRNAFKVMFSLLKLVDKFVIVLFLAVLNGAIGNLLAVSISTLSVIALASLFGLDISISLTTLLILIVVFGILRGVIRYFEQYSNHYIAFKILAIVRHKVFNKLRSLSISDIDDKEKGNMMEMITSDIETLEVFYAHTVSPTLIALIVSTINLTILGLVTNFVLSLTLLLFYIIVGIIIPLISYKVLEKDGSSYRYDLASFNSFFLDALKGIKEIKFLNKIKEKEALIDERSTMLDKKRVKSNNKASIFKAISSSMIILSALSIILVTYLINTYSNNVSLYIKPYELMIGVVIALSSFGPLIALSSLPLNLVQTFTSGNRILDLLDEKPSLNEVTFKKDLIYQHLEVTNLSFKYKDEETNVLNNLNLNLKDNKIIVIKGESGIGKSTLLKLLLRYYEVDNEMIKYNDISINEINTSSLLDNVTMFSQSTYLFNDTILNNLKIANLNASNEEVIDALKKASIYDFVFSLKEGLNTVIDPQKLNVSLGEKQRLGLARVILRKPKLLLLDEPTSNIDLENEVLFLNSLKNIKKDMGIIIITHKESTAKIADITYTLEKGKLYEVKSN